MSRPFFDSNVLIYGYGQEEPRSEPARALIEQGGVISVQCLNEFASVALRKLRMPWDRVESSLSLLLELFGPVVPIDADLHRRGFKIARDYRLSVYDGMIVAAALAAGCDTLYSEDMHAGLVVDGRLTIVNPFIG